MIGGNKGLRAEEVEGEVEEGSEESEGKGRALTKQGIFIYLFLRYQSGAVLC